MFISSAKNAFQEIEHRRTLTHGLLRFGIQLLDDALLGISQSDLVLIGAPSGIGKTQLCCNIAQANIEAGKRVHYIALEAEQYEIERRLKYPLIANAFFSDENRPRLNARLSFDTWAMGRYIDELWAYEAAIAELFEKSYRDLFLFYKQDRFGLNELIEQVSLNGEQTDLIIVDHVHYFDFDDENENRAIKEIAKTARTLALEEQKPIILVSHLRKRDRNNQEIVAGLDEFHGSSDLYKIATKVITMAPGSLTDSGLYETFFRIPKNRINGSVTRFMARTTYDPKTNTYGKEYKIGFAGCTRDNGFEELASHLYPDWAKRFADVGSGRDSNAPRQPSPYPMQGGQGSLPNLWTHRQR